MRAQIAMELRGHIAERLESGQPVADVLRQLGDPTTLAESYLSAVPLVSASFLQRGLAKLIDVVVVVLTILAGRRAARLLGRRTPGVAVPASALACS